MSPRVAAPMSAASRRPSPPYRPVSRGPDVRWGRRVGVDVGDVRIGVAVCDPDGLLATPLETVPAGPDAFTRIAAIVAEHEALECVVGLPLSLSGREGPAAVKVHEFATGLRDMIAPVPV